MTTLAAARPSTVPASRRAGLRILKRLPLWVLIAVVLVIEIYPLVWLLISSFKTQSEFLTQPFWSLPSTPQFSNYVDAFTTGRLGRYILNSAIAVVPALALAPL